jgi:hypothetical protein
VGSFDPYSWLGRYVRATQAIGFSDATTTLGVAELGLSVKPHPRLALAGGYRRERYTQPRILGQVFGTNDARIDLKLRGPVVGLQIDF